MVLTQGCDHINIFNQWNVKPCLGKVLRLCQSEIKDSQSEITLSRKKQIHVNVNIIFY